MVSTPFQPPSRQGFICGAPHPPMPCWPQGNLHGFPRGLSLAAPRKQDLNMSGKTRKNGNGKNGNVKAFNSWAQNWSVRKFLVMPWGPQCCCFGGSSLIRVFSSDTGKLSYFPQTTRGQVVLCFSIATGTVWNRHASGTVEQDAMAFQTWVTPS